MFPKIYNIILDPDPNWAKILDPNPNLMYLDPHECIFWLKTTLVLAFKFSFCDAIVFVLNI